MSDVADIHVKMHTGDVREGQKDIDSFRKSMGGVSKAAIKMSAAVTALGIAVISAAITKGSQQYREMANQLTVVTGSQEAANKKLDELGEVARRTRAPLDAVVKLYSRVSIASRELGVSQEEIKDFVETVGVALSVQGGAASESAGAIFQLSQALGGGIIRMEEFNSIMDGAPTLALAAAEGLDAAGGSVGKLRKLVGEGSVTSKQFFDAILSQSDELREKFELMTPTISQALTTMGGQLVLFVGKMDNVLGASAAIAAAILFLADNVDKLSLVFEVLAAGALAKVIVLLVTGLIPAVASTIVQMIALEVAMGATTKATALFSVAVKGLTVAIRTLQRLALIAFLIAIVVMLVRTAKLMIALRKATGSWGEAWGLVKDLIVEVLQRIMFKLVALGFRAQASWNKIKSDAALAWLGILESLKDPINKIIGAFIGARDAIGVAWGKIKEILANIMIGAANAILGGIESMLNKAIELINDFVVTANTVLSKISQVIDVDLTIGKLDPVKFKDIAPVPTTTESPQDAFDKGFGKDYLGDRMSDLRKTIILLRSTAQTAEESAAIWDAAASQPLKAWEAIKEVLGLTEEEAAALDDTTVKLGGSLADAGNKGKSAADKIADAMKAAQDNIMSVVNTIDSSFREGFFAIVEGTKSAKEAFKDMARAIIRQLFDVLVVQQLVGSFGFSSTGTASGTGLLGFLGKALTGSSIGGLPSAEGGGYTGTGARTGGLDGRGGFMAVLHPNETVTDHTKAGGSQGSGGNVILNQTLKFEANGDESVKRIIADAAPQLIKATSAAILDQRRRGGEFKAVFG